MIPANCLLCHRHLLMSQDALEVMTKMTKLTKMTMMMVKMVTMMLIMRINWPGIIEVVPVSKVATH